MSDSDHHQMDTNGFTNHAELYQQAKKRFAQTALRFAEHMVSGGHQSCDDQCPIYLGFIDAYQLLLSSEPN